MNLFYSLPDDVQVHIHRLSEKIKYDEVIRSIPEHSKCSKETWSSMRKQENVIAQIKSLSSFIKMSSLVLYVGERYLNHLIENQGIDLEKVSTFDYFIEFVRSVLDEKTLDYCYDIENNMHINYTVYTHTLELLWDMQYDAFCT